MRIQAEILIAKDKFNKRDIIFIEGTTLEECKRLARELFEYETDDRNYCTIIGFHDELGLKIWN